MALRIRKDGRIFCAAYSNPEDGDLYLDDFVHSYLSGCMAEKPKILQLDNYNKQTHEYFVKGREKSIYKKEKK